MKLKRHFQSQPLQSTLEREIDVAFADLSKMNLREWFRYFYELGKQSGHSEIPNSHDGLDEAAEGIVCTMINECSAVGIPNDHIPSWVQDAMIAACKAGAEWDRSQGRTFEMDFDGYHSVELTLDKYVLQGVGIGPHDKFIIQIRKP